MEDALILSRRRFLGVSAGAAVVLAVSASQGQRQSAGARPVPLPANGAYAFDDEFTGPVRSAPDPSKWAYDLGGGGWGNHELQVYTGSSANACTDGRGHLVIAAIPGRDGAWTSARLKTEGLFAQVGGSWQARIKLDSQPGFWPAFWLLGADIGQVGWPACGEIDIMEDFGASYVQATVHTPAGPATTSMAYAGVASDPGWHVYQLDLTAAGLAFFRDGAPYLTATAADFPAGSWLYGPGNNGGCFVLLNLAVGGDGPGGAPQPSAPYPVRMLVDYVRVWA